MRFPVFLLLIAAPVCAQTNVAAGRKIFEAQCALCHGQTGTGGRGPSLNRPILNHAPDDDALKKVISEGIEPEMPRAWQLDPQEVARVAQYVRSLGSLPPEQVPGDPVKGAALYQAKGCAACHLIRGVGEGLGPELTDIGARRNAAYLRQAVLNPAGSLPEGFLMLEAVPQSGEVIRGIRVNEDTFTIQIKTSDDRFYSFRKSMLKDLRRLKHQTLMPSFRQALRPAELDDLVAYLASLRGRS
jgi:putative heme-binding domain-containing protein